MFDFHYSRRKMFLTDTEICKLERTASCEELGYIFLLRPVTIIAWCACNSMLMRAGSGTIFASDPGGLGVNVSQPQCGKAPRRRLRLGLPSLSDTAQSVGCTEGLTAPELMEKSSCDCARFLSNLAGRVSQTPSTVLCKRNRCYHTYFWNLSRSVCVPVHDDRRTKAHCRLQLQHG